MWKIARVLTGLIAIVAASAQYGTVEKPVQPAASPARRPEPRVRVMEDPMVLFQNLIGSSSANRRRALLDLGWKEEAKFAEDPNVIGDARFYRVHLDDDPEMEAVLKLQVGRDGTRLLIFKRSEGQWWRIGDFLLWYMWTANDADRMLELRNIVDFDHQDIIIRLTAGGSDIQKETELNMYRLYKGRLYRTFETTEEFALRRFSEPGAEMIEDERNDIYYPEPEQGKDAYFVVRRSKQTMPSSEWGILERPRKIVDCVPYRWDPIKYLFVADRSASSNFCRK
jgi:hypothetical protein